MKHIIVADDDPGIQDVVAIMLKRFGYQPEIHSTADRLLADDFNEPELFIIDRQLQNKDGLDVCRHLKSRKNIYTPVILFSASQRLGEMAHAAGADAFLEKPFTIDTLFRLIKRFVHE